MRFPIFVGLWGLVMIGSAGCSETLADCACVDPSRVGCTAPPPPQHDFLLIEALQGAALDSRPQVDIKPTQAYTDARQNTDPHSTMNVAAIRLPDSCLNETAAQVTGDASRGEAQVAIAQTLCGVWLAELEKALVGANFRVVSWDALHGLERSKNLSSYKAAEELGAGVVFILNSVEAPNVAPGGKAGSQLHYFHSDVRGDRGEPYLMTDTDRAPLRSAVDGMMEQLAHATPADKAVAQVTALSATLDATAVVTKTGEAVWFYRNRTLKPLGGVVGRSFLFVKYENSWQLTRREKPPEIITPKVEALSAEDSSQTTISAGRDQYAVERLELVRNVAEDFVDRYRNGKPGSN